MLFEDNAAALLCHLKCVRWGVENPFFSLGTLGYPPFLNQICMLIYQAPDLSHLCLLREKLQALSSNKMKTDRIKYCVSNTTEISLVDELQFIDADSSLMLGNRVII